MVLESSWFFSGFKIGQQYVGQYLIKFLIGYIFWTKYFLGMIFTWFLIYSISSKLTWNIPKCLKFNFYCKYDIITWDPVVTLELPPTIFKLNLPEQLISIKKFLWTKSCTSIYNWAYTKNYKSFFCSFRNAPSFSLVEKKFEKSSLILFSDFWKTFSARAFAILCQVFLTLYRS